MAFNFSNVQVIAAVPVTGTYTGNGNPTQSITGIGFKPSVLTIYIQASEVDMFIGTTTNQDYSSYYGSQMTADLNVETGSGTWEPDDILSLDAGGFTVSGSGGGVSGDNYNSNGYVFTFIAWP
jgi:hypothetical protein